MPVMVKGPRGLGSKSRLADMGWPVVAWVGGKYLGRGTALEIC